MASDISEGIRFFRDCQSRPRSVTPFLMPTVAEQLRKGREALNLDVHKVAEVTKLKADQIRALEEANYDYFTAAIYLRGSLRTYAALLKLDSTALLAQLDTELTSTKKFADDAPADVRKRTGVDSLMLFLSRNWGIAAIVIGLVIVIVGGNAAYRAWSHHKQTDPLKNLGSGMYQSSEPTGEILTIQTNTGRR
jgi:cytoskeletal protein RodZ